MLGHSAWRCAPRASLPARLNYFPRFSRSPFSTTAPRPAQYNAFARAQYVRYLWKSSPAFRIAVGSAGGAGVIFYVSHLETVPGSGRRRFNCVSPETEKWLAQQEYQETLKEFGGQILSEASPEARMVERVLERLIPNSGIQDGSWEVKVIREDTPNAFVMPG